jgi:CRISPR/Cas system CSM-associated protein Csm3 (group 7 of RAMP superfamily)
MNPYDFVPLADEVRREAPLMHHRFQQHIGTIRCRLTALTPIFIAATQAAGNPQRFITCHYTNQPVIPGSSLKGVIRSVAEAVSPSCIGLSGELFDNRGRLESRYRNKLDNTFETCKSAARLCPSCRLFGMVSSQSHFLGKLGIGEARTQKGQFKKASQMILKPLMSPHPDHTAFYLPNHRVAGRKFYFHHFAPKTTIQQTNSTRTIYPLEGLDSDGHPQTIFEFDVSFSNLTAEEYAVLLLALFLTDAMRHKLGGGKPHGLGSVQIEPIEMRPVDGSQRYKGMARRAQAVTAPAASILTGEPLKNHIKEAIQPLVFRPSNSLAALQRIWQYPPATNANGEPIDYRYPERTWFDTNSDKPLSQTP